MKRLLMKRYDASASVEAVFVFPLVCFSLFAVIFLVMYLYDREKMIGDIICTIEYAKEVEETEEMNDYAAVSDFLENRISRGYMLADAGIRDVSIVKTFPEGKKITISVDLNMRIAGSNILKSIVSGFGNKTITISSGLENREEILRIIDLGLDIWESEN